MSAATPLSSHNISIAQKTAAAAAETPPSTAQKALSSLADGILTGLLEGAKQVSSIPLGQTVFKYAIASDPKHLKAKQVALEKLGMSGNQLSSLIKSIIDPVMKKHFEDAKESPAIQQFMKDFPEMRNATETVLTTAIANLVELAIARHNVKIPPGQATYSMDDLLQGILVTIANIADPHINGSKTDPKTLIDRIASFEEAEKSANEKEIKELHGSRSKKVTHEQEELIKQKNLDIKKAALSKTLGPLMQDILAAALPKGFESAGLNISSAPSFLQSKLKDFLINLGSKAGADFYFSYLEPVATTNARMKSLASSEDGATLIEGIDKGTELIFSMNPLIAKLKALGKHLATSIASKVFVTLAEDKTKPLESSIGKLKDMIVSFYNLLLGNREYIVKNADERQRLRQELKAEEALQEQARKERIPDQGQLKIREAHIEKLNKQIEESIDEDKILFDTFANELWEALAVSDDPLLSFVTEQAKITPHTLATQLFTAFDENIMAQKGLQKWIFPQISIDATKKEIETQALGSATTGIAHGLARLITAPAQALINQEKDSIAKKIVDLINSFFPYLTKGIKTYIQNRVANKLGTLSAPNSKQIDEKDKKSLEADVKFGEEDTIKGMTLWEFLQANLEGISLDFIKTLGEDSQHAATIKALGALSSGGKTQDVVNLLTTTSKDIKNVIDIFTKEYGQPIEKQRPALIQARKQLEECQNALSKYQDGLGNVKLNPGILDQIKKLTNAISKQSAEVDKIEKEFYAPFKDLVEVLLNQLGLDKLFESKDSRFSVFGLDNTIRQQLLPLADTLYQQMSAQKVVAPAPVHTSAGSAAASAQQAESKVQSAAAIPVQAASAKEKISPKEIVELLSQFMAIAEHHLQLPEIAPGGNKKVALFERIAEVERENISDSEKRNKIAEIFRPLIDELLHSKTVGDKTGNILTRLIAANAPPELQSIAKTAASVLGFEMTSMIPSFIASMYPLLTGSLADAEARTKLLHGSAEGNLILEVVKVGSQKILNPLLEGLLKDYTGSAEALAKDDPMLKNLQGIATTLSESLLTNLVLKLAAYDSVHPLRSIINRLKDLLGIVYIQNGMAIKESYQKHLAIKNEIKTLQKNPGHSKEQMKKLEADLKLGDLEREKLLDPLVQRILISTRIGEVPPLTLVPDFAKNFIPGILRQALDGLIESKPGIIAWFNPRESLQSNLKKLADIPNAGIFISLADMGSDLLNEIAPDVIVAKRSEIAHAAVDGVSAGVPLNPALQGSLSNVISNQLQSICANNLLEAPPGIITVIDAAIDEINLLPQLSAQQRNHLLISVTGIIERLHNDKQSPTVITEAVLKEIDNTVKLSEPIKMSIYTTISEKLRNIALQSYKKDEVSDVVISLAAEARPLLSAETHSRISHQLHDTLTRLSHLNPTNDALAEEIVTSLAHTLELKPPEQKALLNAIKLRFQKLAGTMIKNDPLWQFISMNVESLVLEIISNMLSSDDPGKAAIGGVVIKMILGKKIDQDFNPLETIVENFLNIIKTFQDTHKANVQKNYEKDYNAFEKAQQAVEMARKHPPVTPEEMASFASLKEDFNKKSTLFYQRFQPLADELLKSTGLEKVLAEDSRLGILGDRLIRDNILKLCAQLYDSGLNPLKKQQQISQKLSIVLFDPKHAARMAAEVGEKAAKLKSLGVNLPAADQAQQKEILDASGINETAQFVELGNEFLATLIEDQIQGYLKTNGQAIATILNKDVLQKRLRNSKDIEVIAKAIEKLSKGDAKGSKALFDYLHNILKPALLKAIINIFTSTEALVKPPKGEHAQQLLPVNIVANLLNTMKDERNTIENSVPYKTLLLSIRQKEADIEKAPDQATKASMQKQVEDLQFQISTLYSPLSKAILTKGTGVNKKVSDPDHPIHDVQLLPEITRQSIWDNLIVGCLNQYISSHVLKMTPAAASLEQQIKKITGDNTISDFVRILCIVLRDITGPALAKDPNTLAANLIETVLNKLRPPKGAPKGGEPPEFVINFANMLEKNKPLATKVVSNVFNALGTSKISAFKDQLWPALQKLSYPILLQLFFKMLAKIQQIDTPKVRTQIVIDLLELISTHGEIVNAAAVAANKGRVHEVPADIVFKKLKDEGKLHPVIQEILDNPQKEDEIKKKYYSQYVKKILDLIGFTKDDLPLIENEAAFNLVIDELGPLGIGYLFDTILPGKTQSPIESDMYNILFINLLEAQKINAQLAKDKGITSNVMEKLPKELQDLLPEGMRPNEPTIGGIDVAKAMARPQFNDEQQKQLEKYAELILTLLRSKVPDSIAHKPFVKAILDASVKDFAVALRLMIHNGSIIKLLNWNAKLLTPTMIPGEVDQLLDMFKTKDRDPIFTPQPPADPTKVAERKNKVLNLATEVTSDIIQDSIIYALNNWLDSLANVFNLALYDVYKKMDPVLKTTFSIGIKKLVHFIGWGLYILTAIVAFPLGIYTLYLYFWKIPDRVRFNAQHIHDDAFAPHVRNAGLQFFDKALG